MNKTRVVKITTPMLRNMIREILTESLGQTNYVGKLHELKARGNKRTLLENKQYRDLLVQEGVISNLADRIKKALVDRGYMQSEEQKVEDLKTDLSNVKDETENKFAELKDVVVKESGDLKSILDTLTTSLETYVKLIEKSYKLELIDRNEYQEVFDGLKKFQYSPLHELEPGNFEMLRGINIGMLDMFLNMLDRTSSRILGRR